MTSIRATASSLFLIVSLLATFGAPAFAASAHQTCDALKHGCTKIDATAGCCCGDRSDTHPSQVPASQSDLVSPPHVTSPAPAFITPAVTLVFVHECTPQFARPPDLSILFNDLRI